MILYLSSTWQKNEELAACSTQFFCWFWVGKYVIRKLDYFLANYGKKFLRCKISLYEYDRIKKLKGKKSGYKRLESLRVRAVIL